MKKTIDTLYFFAVFCANASMFGAVFGGHAALQAGSSSSAFSSGQSDPVLFAINLAIGLATVFLALPKLPKIWIILRKSKYVFGLYLLSAFSLLWSVDRASTFRTGVYLCLYLVAAAYISIRFDSDQIIHLTGAFIVILGLLSIPGQFILPHGTYVIPGWSGVFLQKNEFGAAMAVGVVALVAANGKRWSLYRVTSIILCTILLLLSQSTTSIFTAGITVFLFIYLRLRRRLKVMLLAAIVGGGVCGAMVISNFASVFTDTTGKNLTLTGRTVVWGLALKQVVRRPELGYGNDAFWTADADTINPFLNWNPGQAHNGYIEELLDLGAAGLLVVLLVAKDALRRASWLRSNYEITCGTWLMLVTVMLLMHNFAEADFLRETIMWFVFLVAFLSSCRDEVMLERAIDYPQTLDGCPPPECRNALSGLPELGISSGEIEA